MQINYKKILIIFICFVTLANHTNSIENRILFKIDDKIITSVDILNEIEYLSLINADLKKFEKNKIFEISKNSLIREKIKEIEISKKFVDPEIEQKYINPLIENFYKSLNLSSIEDFINYIENKNISLETIKKKITIELLWNQVILNKFSKNIKINKQLIENEIIQKNKENKFLLEYKLSEIIFNVKSQEHLSTKIDIIKKSINEDGFNNAALIHSISKTSEKGGELGWIKETSLNQKIKKKIKDINIGHYTNPIVIPGGFIILKIEDIRKIEKNFNIKKEIELAIEAKRNEQLNQFSNIYFSTIKKDIEINEL
jgi:peptidyl-prolyl cis-trans isomerase SurA